MSVLKRLNKLSIRTAISILGIIIGSYVVFISQSLHWDSFYILTGFFILLVAPLAYALYKKTFDPFEPIYLWILLYGFLYFAKPLTQLILRMPFTYGEEFLNKALLVAVAGLISFYLAYYSNFGKFIAAHLPLIQREISSKKLQRIAWIFIGLGFLALSIYIQISGGWEVFWSKPHGYGGLASKTTAYLYDMPQLMIVGFLLIAETILVKQAITKKDIFHLLLAGLGGVGIYTIIWGSRTYASWILLALVLIYYLLKDKRPSLKLIAGAIAGMFLLLIFIPHYRSQFHFGGDITKIFNVGASDILRGAVSPGDEFNAYLAEVALVPQIIPYDFFVLHRSLIFHPIPRLIWPSKPTLLNPHWDEFRAKSGIGWGAAESMLGDFYAQLGIIGVLIGTFISGIFWKTLYEYLMRAKHNRAVIIIYAIMIPNLFTYLAQSSAIAVLKWLPYMMPGTIIALLLSRKKTEKIP